MIGLAGRTKTKILGDNFIITINYLIMKMKKFIWGICACMALCACSDEGKDVTDIDNGNTVIFPNGEAYVNVRIVDAGSTATRATSGDPDYEYADSDLEEGKVKNAKFYFYDQNGAFVTKADVWKDGTPSTTKPDENIEFRGNTVIVLRGLTENTFPKYLVTVLNTPNDFEAGRTLGEVEKKLMGESEIYKSTEGFIMSTTSYKNGLPSEKNLPLYFVTEVKGDNFAKEPAKAEYSTPVTVYVERLAVKVKLGVDDESLKPAKGEMYKLNVTIAGNQNDQGTTDDLSIGATDVYIKFEEWGLNATTKDSYLVKNIDESWTDANLGFAWNKEADHRSFWGMSYNYGISDGAFATGAFNASENGNGKDSEASKYLEYIKASDCNKSIGSVDYCGENTNTGELASNRAAVTSILLKARVCGEDGTGLDLVRYNGVLFKKDDYLRYVLNTQGVELYYKNGIDEHNNDKYDQINENHVELVNLGDGKVKVQLKEEKPTDGLYSKGEIVDGKQQFDKVIVFEEYNNKLAFKDVENHSDAIAYTGGLMYYNIPIEHLNNEKGEKLEAKYGVVRNHYYKVTINKLENIGKGIYDPDEVIVPSVDDEKENYYVGATINILSWKVVSQNVGL